MPRVTSRLALSASAAAAAAAALAAVALAAGPAAAAPAAAAASAAPSCKTVPQPKPRQDGGQQAPKRKLDPKKTYDVVVETNCGSFTIRLDPRRAPNIAASFAALVQAKFYDRTIFHRIVPGFVIQGGDPTVTGGGGPGYSVVDTPPKDLRYGIGVVAAAKTAAEKAGTTGSQFFVATGENAAQLPPDYGLIGRIVKGLDVALLIGTFGNDQQQPTRIIEIRKMTLKVS